MDKEINLHDVWTTQRSMECLIQLKKLLEAGKDIEAAIFLHENFINACSDGVEVVAKIMKENNLGQVSYE